jgi:hypothetical protein
VSVDETRQTSRLQNASSRDADLVEGLEGARGNLVRSIRRRLASAGVLLLRGSAFVIQPCERIVTGLRRSALLRIIRRRKPPAH